MIVIRPAQVKANSGLREPYRPRNGLASNGLWPISWATTVATLGWAAYPNVLRQNAFQSFSGS
jgi:hypothetical protein